LFKKESTIIYLTSGTTWYRLACCKHRTGIPSRPWRSLADLQMDAFTFGVLTVARTAFATFIRAL